MVKLKTIPLAIATIIVCNCWGEIATGEVTGRYKHSSVISLGRTCGEPNRLCQAYDSSTVRGNLELTPTQNYREVDSSDRFVLTQQSNQETNYLGKILLIGGLASVAGFIGWQLSRSLQSGSSGSLLQPTKHQEQPLLNRVNPRLRRKLLRLINDPKTVNRLLMGIEKNHPHRSADWMAEKVIYDFQRGR